MLERPNLNFIKGYYDRPADPLDYRKAHLKLGGGRVTELVAKQLINHFFPFLTMQPQPLSGEYGGKREVLDQLEFYTGYSVEMGLLIGIHKKFGLETMGIVDLKKRDQKHQDDVDLAKMSFGIMKAVLEEAEKYGHLTRHMITDNVFRRPEKQFGELSLSEDIIDQVKRAPMITKELYQEKFPERKKAYYQSLNKGV
jgi:glucosyl-3-phosphoglycerate synthase